MPVIVACRCGKRFAAKDHLLGQQVACPSCGRPLVVAASPTAPPGVYVACTCGRAFMAPESMRGQQAQCRGCGRILQVPGYTPSDDPLGLGPLGPLDALPTTLPRRESEIPWDTLKVIGGWGAGLLAVVILITSTMNFIRWMNEQAANEAAVAAAPAAIPQSTPAPVSGSSSSSSSSAKLPPALPPADSTGAELKSTPAANVTSSKSS